MRLLQTSDLEKSISMLPRLFKRMHEKGASLNQQSPVEYTPAQINALHVIASKPEWRMSHLSDRLRVSAGSLTTMVNRLIDAELVTRTRSELDRRVVTVKVTEKGRSLLDASRDRVLTNLQAVLGELSTDDQQKLSDALQTMADILGKIV